MMKRSENRKDKSSYSVVIAELGSNPFGIVKIAFALMSIIPLLIIFYIVLGKNLLYRVFLGNGGLVAGIAILISVIGFIYAYKLIKDMTAKLLVYSAERRRADEEKTELLLAITHDLKTPVTVIKAGLENLMDGIGGIMNQAQLGMAKTCVNAVSKITNFIDDLLDISNLGFIRAGVRRERLDFGKLVSEEVKEISTLAKKKKHDLDYSFFARDANLWADKKKLSRAVMNLLSNAVKYTPEGGKIRVNVSGDENTIRLIVANSGSGIYPADLDKIFSKYTRLKSHASTEGTGIGLSIVKEIIDLHNGHIAVKSDPDRETEFSVILPRDLRGGKR